MLQRDSHVDEQHHAYGEIVWSWHPDADAKLAVMIIRR
jgi:hypothetical protein